MKKIILAIVCIISIFSIDKEAYAASGDFTMPTSKVYVEEALLKDGIYYTTSQDIELIIDASDDVTSPENLKMYIPLKTRNLPNLFVDMMQSKLTILCVL